MNANDAEPADDQFADLLAIHEDALLHGAPPAEPPPPELRGRIDDALRCVEMLQRLWPRPVSAGADEASDQRRGERYRLLRAHATGGIGRVWVALDANLDREVALKEPRPERAADPALARRFLREARITGRLQHPGIVPVYELAAVEDGEPPFYTMRLVRGRTLTEAIRTYHDAGRPRSLEQNALLDAFVGVCNTVAYAHAQGVIHRDIKSENVVVGDFGEVVLLDWGFAKELELPDEPADGDDSLEAEPGQTVAGQVVGTPAYMAPEQAAGLRDQIGPRTDVYGLGAVLYEILTGQQPFTGADTRELIRQARETAPPRPEQVCRSVPLALSAVCRRAMARAPEDRYATAAELAGEVQRWLADEPTTAYRESVGERLRRWGRRRKPLVAGLAVLLVTSFTAAMIGLFLLEKERARTADVRAQAAAEQGAAETRAREVVENLLYVERLARAERELAAHNLARATQLLAECPPERRGWEWACLQRLCHTDLTILREHTAPVSGTVFCLDGTRVVTASHDHTLKIWDPATGREPQTLRGHKAVIHCLTVSPDGKRLASGGWDHTARVWDAATGAELQVFSGHGDIVIRVAFVDARVLATVSGARVTLWDVETGREIRRFERAGMAVYGLAVSPDGHLLATGEGDNALRLWDLHSGAPIRTLLGHHSPPKHLAFSPDGRLLAAGDGLTLESEPGVVKLWDVEKGAEVATLEGHTYPVFSVAFSPDGRRLVSGSQDNSIKVWDVARAQLVLTLRGHADVVRSLAFSPDGARLASASADRTVRLWDAALWTTEKSPGEAQPPRDHGADVLGVAFIEDRLVSLSRTGSFKSWDPAPGGPTVVSNLTDGDQRFYSFAVSPLGDVLALGTASGSIILADPNTGRRLGECVGHGAGPVKGLAFSKDGTRVAAAEWRGAVRVWDVKTRTPSAPFWGHAEPVVAVAFSPDGRTVASGGNDQTVRIWDATTGKQLQTLRGHASRLTAVAFHPDGQVLASASNDGRLKLWDVATGRESHDLAAHTGAISDLAFSPDGRLLASAGDDWALKLWDATTGAEVATFRGHTGAVRTLAFDRAGARLASAGQDATVRVWVVPQ